MLFLSCKANTRVKLAKMGHSPQSSKLVVICVVLLLFVLFYVLFVFVLFYVLCVCKCVLYYCHWVLTQLQLTNIYHIISTDPMVPLSTIHLLPNITNYFLFYVILVGLSIFPHAFFYLCAPIILGSSPPHW